MASYLDTYDIATQGINTVFDHTFGMAVQGFHVIVEEVIIIPPVIDDGAPITGGAPEREKEKPKKLIRLKVTLPSGEYVEREVVVDDVDLTVDDVHLDTVNESVTLKLTDIGTRKKSIEIRDIKLHE